MTTAPRPPAVRATVRTYRHGLGDCHLVTLRGTGNRRYRILIDCGVILGTADADAKMTAVMEDVAAACDHRLDLLVATHEHWDHLSGFVQAADAFARIKVDHVWMAWTEDPDDDDARALRRDRDDALAMLRGAAASAHAASDGEPTFLDSLLEFFGPAAAATTKSALEAVRAKVAAPRYCDPADAPVELPGVGARVYVLGPPRDVSLLKKSLPSKTGPETYTLALERFRASAAGAPGDADDRQPFTSLYRIPFDAARGIDFFARRYWDGPERRRIDDAGSGAATDLGIALDNLTNNTSLVLAIDLGAAGVLLFAADAQVGNWLSWGDCRWSVDGRAVTGHDLLKRTVLYKVGHHGSHNATLRARGLDLMTSLKVALVPVDRAMALKKRWGDIPLASLEAALEQATAARRGVVLRTDRGVPAGTTVPGVRGTPLYVEVDV